MKGIHIDSESGVVGEHYAVVFAPRRQRGRFPENCVRIVESAAAAIQQSNDSTKEYAAKVVGPSRSSEGVKLYYLERWL